MPQQGSGLWRERLVSMAAAARNPAQVQRCCWGQVGTGAPIIRKGETFHGRTGRIQQTLQIQTRSDEMVAREPTRLGDCGGKSYHGVRLHPGVINQNKTTVRVAPQS